MTTTGAFEKLDAGEKLSTKEKNAARAEIARLKECLKDRENCQHTKKLKEEIKRYEELLLKIL